MNRWAKDVILVQVFEYLHKEQITNLSIEALCLDSTIIKVHTDGPDTLKNGKQSIGKSRGSWTIKLHMLCTNDRFAVAFPLSGGQCHDAPKGRAMLEDYGAVDTPISLLTDKADEGTNTRDTALKLGYSLCAPPKSSRKET